MQLTVIVLAARIGAVLRCASAIDVVGEIVIGILLGPHFLVCLRPTYFIRVSLRRTGADADAVSNRAGVLMFRSDWSSTFSLSAKRNRRAVMWIASFSWWCHLYWVSSLVKPVQPLCHRRHPLGTALFVATAFSITALPILGRIMMEFNMTRTRSRHRHQCGGDQ